MQKIPLKKYFEISNSLENSTQEDFKIYKKELLESGASFNKDNKLQELLDFSEKREKDISLTNFFEHIDFIKDILLWGVFMFTLLISYFAIDETININKFIIFSIFLPFLYITIMSFKILRYSFPKKDEHSFLSYILSYSDFIEYNPIHSHIIKTYSMKLSVYFGLVYTLAILFYTFIIFFTTSVSFVMPSTFDIDIFSFISNISKEEFSQSLLAWLLITFIVIFILIPKVVLLFFANRNIEDSIKISLLEQGEDFFDIIYTSVEIKEHTEIAIVKEIDEEEKFSEQIMAEEASLFSDYYNLYYNMDFETQQKIIFDFDNDVDLKEKSFQEFSYAIFGEEDEDEQTILKLGNLVLIFTSPETSADNTFKDDVEEILKQESIQQIWIIPLVEDTQNNYIIATKGDDKYSEWQKQININLANPKVRLYNEK